MSRPRYVVAAWTHRELRPDTMESKLVNGLFLVGELTDVDGICGGYNLQWAWSTGAVAGRTAGRN